MSKVMLWGFRSPYADLPTATYIAYVPAVRDGICGTVQRFTIAELQKLYGNKKKYMKLFSEYLYKQERGMAVECSDYDRKRRKCASGVSSLGDMIPGIKVV